MTIQANVVYPAGLAKLLTSSRNILVNEVRFQETYGGVIEGAPRPEWDARLRVGLLADLKRSWGDRATHVVPPEVVEIHGAGRVIRRMPAVACAAWLVSDPIDRHAGAASELVLVWWTESLDDPVGAIVGRALAGVEWERVAQDFDY